jgi:hypothetical protein
MGFYHYTTCDTVTGNVNVIENQNHPDDIEGLWTFFYYSYSVSNRLAVGFVKYGNGESKKISMSVTHPKTNFLRFILGGKDADRFPGFNGLFTNVVYND